MANDGSSFFKDIAKGSADMGENLQAQFLGPTYEYAKKVRNPTELGMSGRGSLSALADDVNGLIQYMRILVEGGGQASVTGKPLGGKFYLKTGGKCKGPDGGTYDRYIYVNNIPMGNLPIVSSVAGSNISTFRGLIPGTIENTGKLNPLSIFGGFMQKTNPPCRKLDLPSDSSPSSAYVADSDIADLDPCLWVAYGKGGSNPVTNKAGRGCATSGFQNMEEIKSIKKTLKLKENPMANLYNLSFGMLIVYLIYHLTKKYN